MSKALKPKFVLNQFGTYYLAFEDMAIHNPRFSTCGRFFVSPETYGFHVWHTGGGCTAWRLDGVLEDSGKPVYMVLTNGDLGHLWNTTDPTEIGVYDEDGNFVFWEQAEGDIESVPPTNIHKQGVL